MFLFALNPFLSILLFHLPSHHILCPSPYFLPWPAFSFILLSSHFPSHLSLCPSPSSLPWPAFSFLFVCLKSIHHNPTQSDKSFHKPSFASWISHPISVSGYSFLCFFSPALHFCFLFLFFFRYFSPSFHHIASYHIIPHHFLDKTSLFWLKVRVHFGARWLSSQSFLASQRAIDDCTSRRTSAR